MPPHQHLNLNNVLNLKKGKKAGEGGQEEDKDTENCVTLGFKKTYFKKGQTLSVYCMGKLKQ